MIFYLVILDLVKFIRTMLIAKVHYMLMGTLKDCYVAENVTFLSIGTIWQEIIMNYHQMFDKCCMKFKNKLNKLFFFGK